MQRLEIVWLRRTGQIEPEPLTDEAHYWEIAVKSCDGERYYEIAGFGEDGNGGNEHVVPFSLVRSVSAREITEERIEEKGGSGAA